MKLHDGVEWALHCATVLALLPENAVLSGKALAEFRGVSESQLLKHLKRLTAAGVLVAVPGPGGGYRLSRPMAEISFLDIVEAIIGSAPLFRCREIRQRGPASLGPSAYSAPCIIHAAMQQADAAWRAQLAAVTFNDMAIRLDEVHPGSRAKGLDWIAKNMREPQQPGVARRRAGVAALPKPTSAS